MSNSKWRFFSSADSPIHSIFFFQPGVYLWKNKSKYVAKTTLLWWKCFPTIFIVISPPRCKSPWLCVFSLRARPPSTSSILHRQTQNQPPISLNSLNRQALTGIDRCSDGGMWMSHVFSIIYTALLFLSPPLRQVSILLRRNQSVICQPLSIRRLIYVSYCGWLHAKRDTGKGNKCWRETLFARRQQVFWEVGFLFSSSASSRQNSATAESGFIYLFFLLEPRPRTAVDRVGGLKYLVVDSRTFGVLYHMRGGLRHETFTTRRNSAQYSFFFSL